MANGQMPGLAGLAQGLRLAGGILSPSAREANLEEDKLQAQQAQQMKLAQIQQTVKGIEMGAIEPEAGRAVLKQLGFEAPVGPGPEAIARQEMVQRKREMAAAMKNLPPDASFEDRLTAMAPHLEPSQQIAAFNAVTSKREQLALREKQLEQAHEVQLLRAGNDQERNALKAQFESQRLEIANMRARSDEAWKTLQSQLGTERLGLERERVGLARERAARGRDLTMAETTALQNLSTEVSSLSSLAGSFKDDYAGKGILGGPYRAAIGRAGSLGTQTMQDAQEFWSKYERMVELPLRHEMFGATLTNNERMIFDQARALKPGDDPARVRKALGEMKQISNTKLDAIETSLKARGKSAAGVEALTAPAREGTPPAAIPARQPVSVTGANETTQITRGGAPVPVGGKMPPRPTSEAEYEAIPAGTTYIAPDGKERRKR